MFGNDKGCLAVVIGESTVTAAYVSGSGPAQKLAGLGAESLEGVDPSQWGGKIRAMAAGLGAKKFTAVCVIPSTIVTTKNIEIPSLDKEEIRSIIDLQAGRHTPYSREEILVTYVSVGVFQRNYTKVLLIIANRDVVRLRLEACEAAGIRIDKVVFAPECVAGLYADLLDIDPDDDPLGIIDIGQSATDFIVEHNQTVATCRTIPVGIKDFLAEGPQGGKERLLDELAQSLEIYRNEDINKVPSRYVLTADAVLAEGLSAALQERLQAEVVRTPYTQKIFQNSPDSKMTQRMTQDSFASAVAAAHLCSRNLQADLMPEEVKNRRAVEDQGRQVIITGILSMLILLLVGGLFFMRIYFRNAYLNMLKQEYAVKRYAVVHLDRIAHRTRIIKDFLTTRMMSLDVIEEIYQHVPHEMYLQNIFLDEEGTVNVQGISESMSMVFNVVKALEDSVLFKNVKTRSTTATKDRGKDVAAFDLTFRLEIMPDIEIGQVQPDEGGDEDL